MELNEKRNAFFTPDQIGAALAHVVSKVEGDDYIYTYVYSFKYGWIRGEGDYVNHFYSLAIVKSGFEDCKFCLNENSPWMKTNIVQFIPCTRDYVNVGYDYRQYNPFGNKVVNFKEQFTKEEEEGANPFPYLDDLIQELAANKVEGEELAVEKIMEIADSFVDRKIQENNAGKEKVNKKTT